MKKYFILAFLILLSLGFAVAQNVITESNNQNLSDKSSIPVTYTCPMHHEINTDKPGKCPVCSMDLVPKVPAQYSCPMHPVVISSAPGKCPKCGMDLVLESAAPYSCPMHPEVTSKKPGKCSICGMKLQKAKSEKHTMPMDNGNMHQGHSM